jgi:hypothetical protein
MKRIILFVVAIYAALVLIEAIPNLAYYLTDYSKATPEQHLQACVANIKEGIAKDDKLLLLEEKENPEKYCSELQSQIATSMVLSPFATPLFNYIGGLFVLFSNDIYGYILLLGAIFYSYAIRYLRKKSGYSLVDYGVFTAISLFFLHQEFKDPSASYAPGAFSTNISYTIQIVTPFYFAMITTAVVGSWIGFGIAKKTLPASKKSHTKKVT